MQSNGCTHCNPALAQAAVGIGGMINQVQMNGCMCGCHQMNAQSDMLIQNQRAIAMGGGSLLFENSELKSKVEKLEKELAGLKASLRKIAEFIKE